MVREVLKYSNALRAASTPVAPAEFNSDWLKGLVADLFATMHDCQGVGLAAPQIGIFKCVAVIDFSEKRKQPDGKEANAVERWVLINPVLEEASGQQKHKEGCLSIPGFQADILRPMEVVCRFQDEVGEYHRIVGEGLLARAISHEVDHLNSVILPDRMGPVTRDLFHRRWRKSIKRAAQA